MKAGRLHVVFRGVYEVGHPHLAPLGIAQAALLIHGDSAFLSHRTAGAMWRMLDTWPAEPDVTVARRSVRDRDGIRIHRVRTLPAAHATRRHGLPVTTPERTLLDLAEVLPFAELTRALGEAEYLRVTSRPRVRALALQARGRHGVKPLLDLLGGDDLPQPTHSPLEDRFLDLVKQAALPRPESNVRVNGVRADFLWRDHGVVVETDGWAAHGTPAQRDRDDSRDTHHQIAGLRTMRVSRRRLAQRPFEVIAQLAQLLATARG